MARERKIGVEEIRLMKGRTKIAALTCVDAPSAAWCDEAGVDLVLVGDSLSMVSLGMSDTQSVTVEQMVSATAAARRGLSSAGPLLVADIPLAGLDRPLESARRLVEAGADAVKLECHEKGASAVAAIVDAGIEVMAHVGLMPQTVTGGKGYGLKGADAEEARRIESSAKAAEAAGAFACVLEKMPSPLAVRITASLAIPTIGIGAGPGCDGQILVLYDLLGVFERFRPKFVRRYLEMTPLARTAVASYVGDVKSGSFPSQEESFE